MSKMARVFERNGHSYQLYEVQADPVWNLFEDFGDEAALVGSITQNGPQFRIECYWKPEPGARLHDIGARTVDEAVSALLDLTAGEDPRGVMNRRVRSDGSTLRRAVIDHVGKQHHPASTTPVFTPWRVAARQRPAW